MSELHEMSLRERIRLNLVSSMEAANINQVQLADKLGISKGTVNNWARGNNSPDVDMVPKICKVLGISVLDLYAPTKFESSDVKETKKAPSLPDEAMKVAKDYWALDRWGRQVVRSVIADEKERCEDPQGAVFAIRVQGDSMEPHFPNGSIAFCNKDPLADGDIGVFCLDGDSFIKQYHHDKFMGMTYLFSLNRDRADADKLITRTGGQTLTCFGRVMTRRRFPVPGAGGI